MEDQSHYIDRDVSWLSFNRRVLEEAQDSSLPLYERIKFLAIYSSNLDEFYRVRVASLRSLQKLNKKKFTKKFQVNPDILLPEIKDIVERQQEIFGITLRENILPDLFENGIKLVYHKTQIPESIRQELDSYFRSRILSYLQPVILKPGKKAFLTNTALYLLLKIHLPESDDFQYAYVNIPSPPLSRFYASKNEGINYFIFIDDIIRLNLDYLFPGFEVSEAFSIKLNRDADLQIDDEYSGDLVEKLKSNLEKRNIGIPSRFLYDLSMPIDMLAAIIEATGIEDEEAVAGGRYHNLNDLFGLPNPRKPDLEIIKWPSLVKQKLENSHSLFKIMEEKDQLFNFPYHSYDYVLRFFNEAAIDPKVREIKVTFYRVASDSFIVNALISAARNGKKVKAFVEIKARFDEENNLRWAERMKQAGIKITFSMPGLKVHAKAALVSRDNEDGEPKLFAFFGTGNFNEKTAGIYADHGLLTCNKDMTLELDMVFKYLYKRSPVEKLDTLLVSQFNIVDKLEMLIDREIQHARDGKKARIHIKVNNLEDTRIIDKLYEASIAGVKIKLIVRGICRLIPGEFPYSANISIIRLVDRYLEHARIFAFYNDGENDLYMGSADLMRRNLYHRIEVVFPVLDPDVKAQISALLAFQLNDNMKSRKVDADGNNNVILLKNGTKRIRAQENYYQWLANLEANGKP